VAWLWGRLSTGALTAFNRNEGFALAHPSNQRTPRPAYDRIVQLRRTLLAFALVLAAVSLAAALSSPREEEESPPPSGPIPRATAPAAVNVGFRHPVAKEPPVRTVRNGAHVIVRVQAQVAGNAEIAGLGLLQSVAPGTPAVFDLLAARSGRFEVSLVSVAGERTRLGTLEVGD
jgi:hypothetical protein